jgi:hypothetical protein
MVADCVLDILGRRSSALPDRTLVDLGRPQCAAEWPKTECIGIAPSPQAPPTAPLADVPVANYPLSGDSSPDAMSAGLIHHDSLMVLKPAALPWLLLSRRPQHSRPASAGQLESEIGALA